MSEASTAQPKCGEYKVKVQGREYCRRCAPDHLQKKLPKSRSATLASILSVVPGLGQMYAGRKIRGLVFGASAVSLAVNPEVMAQPMPLFLWIYNLFDAYSLTQERNAKVQGEELSGSDKRQRRFWGLFASAVAIFAGVQATIEPSLNPDLLWPVGLALYGISMLFDRGRDENGAMTAPLPSECADKPLEAPPSTFAFARRMPPPPSPRAMPEVGADRRDPLLALVLSTLIPGGGQVYNSHFIKGVLVFVTSPLVIPWLIGMADAFFSARRINDRIGFATAQPA